MSEKEYTPDDEVVREQYSGEQPPHIGSVSEKQVEFDRWLAEVRREAAYEALDKVVKHADILHRVSDNTTAKSIWSTVAGFVEGNRDHNYSKKAT